MNWDVFITCAVTGSGDTTGKSDKVPVTPKEIADSALDAAKAGAAVVHIHVRDPRTGKGTRDVDLYAEVVDRIRSSNTDVVLNLTAGMGGDVWIGDLLFIAAAFCWSAYSVIVRRYGLDAVRATMAITAFALVSFVPAYALLVNLYVLPSQMAQADWSEIVFQAGFQGVGSVVISGITFTQMIRTFGPIKSTMITALVPGLSALGAVVFLGEPLSWNLWAGLALVTGGILFGVRQAVVKS